MNIQLTKKYNLTCVELDWDCDNDDFEKSRELLIAEFKKKNKNFKENLGELFSEPSTILIKSKQDFADKEDYSVKQYVFNLVEDVCYALYKPSITENSLSYGCADNFDSDEMRWLLVFNKNSPYCIDEKGTVKTIAYVEQNHFDPMFAIVKIDMFRQSRAEFSSTL